MAQLRGREFIRALPHLRQQRGRGLDQEAISAGEDARNAAGLDLVPGFPRFLAQVLRRLTEGLVTLRHSVPVPLWIRPCGAFDLGQGIGLAMSTHGLPRDLNCVDAKKRLPSPVPRAPAQRLEGHTPCAVRTQ